MQSSLKELQNKKKTYEDALVVLQPKLDDLVSMPQEIETAKRQMEAEAQSEEYDQAVKYAKDLTAMAGHYNSLIPSVEIVQKKNAQEYDVEITILQQISTDTSDSIDLQLIHPKLANRLKKYEARRGGCCADRWDVVLTGPQDTTVIGEFKIESSKLVFRWKSESAMKQASFAALRNCLLKVSTAQKGSNGKSMQFLLRRVREDIEPLNVGNFKHPQKILIDDLWPSVPLSIVNIACHTSESEVRTDDLMVFGSGSHDEGKLFFKLSLNENAGDTAKYSRQCAISLNYLGVKLARRLVSDWNPGEVANNDFHTYLIYDSQIPIWQEHIRNRRKEITDKIESQNKEKKKDEKLIARWNETIQQLDVENSLTSTIANNLQVAKGSNVEYAICFDMKANGQKRDVVVARTKKEVK